jgi:hypothetical protein
LQAILDDREICRLLPQAEGTGGHRDCIKSAMQVIRRKSEELPLLAARSLMIETAGGSI